MMYKVIGNQDICITAVYAKCKSHTRKDLWCALEQDNQNVDIPWCIGGDFNVILDTNEKLGGKRHIMHMSLDFKLV